MRSFKKLLFNTKGTILFLLEFLFSFYENFISGLLFLKIPPSPSPVFLIQICLHIIVLSYMIVITGNFSVLKPYIFVYALVWKYQEQWIRDKPLCLCVK